jgi:hypothetical protein
MCVADVLRAVVAVAPRCMKDHGIELPCPIADGGGPSSTFTTAAFGAMLAGAPSWGAHVALRLTDAVFPPGEEPVLAGPHIGVFH